MQASNLVEKLRAGVVAAFEPAVDPNAPGLVSVLRRSVEFANVDTARSQIVVDRRALLLAFVAVGVETSSQYANMATWFADWLKHRLPDLDLPSIYAASRTSDAALEEAAGNGFALVLSESVRSASSRAIGIAESTVNRPKISLRHLFFALLEQPNHRFEIEEFGWSATEADRADLRRLMFERMGSDPQSSESIEAWRSLLGQSTVEPPSPTTPKPDPEPNVAPPPPTSSAWFVSGFDADRTSGADDPLNTNADVRAMARLLCYEGAEPPISVGIFGGWGSGKSTFMEALQLHLKQLADPEAAAAPSGDGPRFVSPIVQIRFNAWQFADANLWASLTAEFFDQLRAGGFEGGGQTAHAKLIADVNEHVRGLSREAGLRKAAVAEADERLHKAQVAHDKAVKDRPLSVRQAMVSGFAEAYENNRRDLVRQGLIDPNSRDQLSDFIGITKDVRSQYGQLKRILRLKVQWPLLVGLGIALVVAGIAALLITHSSPAAAATTILAAAVGLAPTVRRGLALIGAIFRQTAQFADKIEEAEGAGLREVLAKEVAVRSAAEEADALREASERADRALARYVDPEARSNPPRVLRYLLEDDPDTKAFEQEIGLIGRARRLFHALDEIVADNRSKKLELRSLQASLPAAPDQKSRDDIEARAKEIDKEIPDRIILYIDDLDRCTHDQVYKVLQAVHLLLAFRLFVVVVAVDMEWVEAAVAKSIEFAGKESEEDDVKEAKRRERAIEYLSKIFQLPFWLKPFDGADDGRYGNYIRSLTRAAKPPPPPPPPADANVREQRPTQAEADQADTSTAASPAPASAPQAGDEAIGGIADKSGLDRDPQPLRAEALERALRTLQLAEVEESFLASAAISALAASDPRGVKRLVNVYKIVRARLSETDDAMILGGPGNPPAFPLIALFAAIETGQPLEIADDFYTEIKDGDQQRMLTEIQVSEELKGAVAAVVQARENMDVPVDEALEIARVVRRYSFNKYH